MDHNPRRPYTMDDLFANGAGFISLDTHDPSMFNEVDKTTKSGFTQFHTFESTTIRAEQTTMEYPLDNGTDFICLDTHDPSMFIGFDHVSPDFTQRQTFESTTTRTKQIMMNDTFTNGKDSGSLDTGGSLIIDVEKATELGAGLDLEGRVLSFLSQTLTSTKSWSPGNRLSIVSVDFEGLDAIREYLGHKKKPRRHNAILHAQLGVAILDTTRPSSSGEQSIRTFNFGIGGCHSRRRIAEKRVRHGGLMKWIEMRDIRDSLENLIDRTRDIVLLGHGFGGDLTVLSELGFDLKTSVVAILDTHVLARPIVGPRNLKLAKLLTTLDVPYAKLHNAGNDAYYTLQAFLALVKGGGRRKEKEDLQEVAALVKGGRRKEKKYLQGVATLDYSLFPRAFVGRGS